MTHNWFLKTLLLLRNFLYRWKSRWLQHLFVHNLRWHHDLIRLISIFFLFRCEFWRFLKVRQESNTNFIFMPISRVLQTLSLDEYLAVDDLVRQYFSWLMWLLGELSLAFITAVFSLVSQIKENLLNFRAGFTVAAELARTLIFLVGVAAA